MLPGGESISTAAAGFKNEGQFLAALNVSQKLNIPFDDLKAKMTGSNPMSLGAAIRALKLGMSVEEAKEHAKKAARQARICGKDQRFSKVLHIGGGLGHDQLKRDVWFSSGSRC